MPKRVRRSFNACWTCRRRRVACDGVSPACSPCKRRSLDCEGYDIRLAWVDSYDGTYETHSRRSVNPAATWAGQRSYTSDQLDHLVDLDLHHIDCNCGLHSAPCNPFRTLELSDDTETPCTDVVNHTDGYSSIEELSLLNIQAMPMARPSSEGMLLHHYVSEVASLMMPIDSGSNPWRSVYPAIAVRNATHASQCLYEALLSQAAFHLSLLHGKSQQLAQQYQVLANKHYCSAIKNLRNSLEHHLDDFSAYTASLHTLTQIEGCYAPGLHEWRTHFSGASGLLAPFLKQQPWTTSSNAWVLSQSLALSFEIAHTGSSGPATISQVTDTLLSSVSQTERFGYTIGASGPVILSISRIRRLAQTRSEGDPVNTIDIEAGKILSDLRLSTPDAAASADSDQLLSNIHQRIFRNAAAIYLYRTFYNVVPVVLQDRVSEVLDDTIDFLRRKGGSISLWPVFIAAVEVCTEEDRHKSRYWMEYSCRLGINNRLLARRIIEEVWSQRDKQSQKLGIHGGNVPIDWRRIQTELNIDICLL